MKLKEVLQEFCSTSFSLCLGVELEFYAQGCEKAQLDYLLQSFCKENNCSDAQLVDEEGEGQFEIVLAPEKNIILYADLITQLCHHLSECASQEGFSVNLSAKPYVKQPASALHVHISLYDDLGKNIYAKTGGNESEYLLWSVASLLDDLPASMRYFSPKEEDYLRYRHPDRNTPATISWGGENRTVAIRIPAVGDDQQQRRIEHRVPSPQADIYMVFASIITSIRRGLEKRHMPAVQKTHGNAWDSQYRLELLPTSLREAVQNNKPVL